MKHNRRGLTLFGILASTALVLTACAATPEATPEAPTADADAGAPAEVETTRDTLTLSYSAGVMQVEKVPLHLALESLKDQGIDTTETFHQSGEDGIQAVAQGESDFGVSNASSVFAATKKGVPIKAIFTGYRPDYMLIATADIEDTGQLDGKRVAIHAQVSSTTLYTQLALAEYPEAEPKILVVPGSANRIQALKAGQIDASVVQLADWLALDKESPGKYHVLYNVAAQNPEIIDSVVFTSTKIAEDEPAYVEKFVSGVLATYAEVNGDEPMLADALVENVEGTTPEAATTLAKNGIQDGLWPADGGFTEATVNATLEKLGEAELLTAETLPTFEECCTTQFLE